MCGISGIITKRTTNRKLPSLNSLNNLISHRGPDSSGFYSYKNVEFGHKRLSIIDLSTQGEQPMTYGDRYVITYNGEVYNYLELKEELLAQGYSFISNSDTEVIIAAYDFWGENCVNHFNGMWAFAILDTYKDKVFLSRDRFGIKPLYYYDCEDFFAFGSEIKQLLPLLERREPNVPVIIDYLVFGMEDHLDSTFFSGIKKLSPSHSIIYNLETHFISNKCYFDITQTGTNEIVSENEAVDKFMTVFKDSIKLRLRSDVKVGACLSGGLDSSSIVAIASRLYMSDSNFLAFHVTTNNDPKYNELPYVQELIKDLPVDLVIVDGSVENVKKNIEEVIRVQEEPFGSLSIILQYLLMQKAKEMNCKVLLDGQGGDESLLGYERYYPSIFLTLKPSKKLIFLTNVVRKSKLNLIALLAYTLYFTNSFVRIAVLRFRNTYIKKSSFKLLSKSLITSISMNYRNIFSLQRQEIFSTQLPHLLRYEDKNSMFFSIETRLPFLDYRCIKVATSINPLIKLKDGWSKYVLRKAIDGHVPQNIAWRKNKIGFELPQNEIIKNLDPELIKLINESPLLSQILEKDKLVRNFNFLDDRIKWRLYNIAKWEQLFEIVV